MSFTDLSEVPSSCPGRSWRGTVASVLNLGGFMFRCTYRPEWDDPPEKEQIVGELLDPILACQARIDTTSTENRNKDFEDFQVCFISGGAWLLVV